MLCWEQIKALCSKPKQETLFHLSKPEVSSPTWEGTKISRHEWEIFLGSAIWKAFLFELSERETFLVQLFKDNDLEWNADCIRGKLLELEFFKQIPQSIVTSINIEEKNKQLRKEDADEYTGDREHG